MVIQHNIPAINAHRNLGINNNATAKNLEKLSSGYRINRAGDDAAGLAISEKMRGQIRGLQQATRNAENGISLIQTAEGGLNETHAILQRMRELAVQSANGTYQDNVDREAIDLEAQALKSEIDRISSSTHYNGINLLDGTLGGYVCAPGAGTPDANASARLVSLGLNDTNQSVLTLANPTPGATATLIINNDGAAPVLSLVIGDKTYISRDNGASFIDPDDATVPSVASLSNFNAGAVNTSGVITGITHGNEIDEIAGAIISVETDQLIFQIGANGRADQEVGLHVANMSTSALGTSASTFGVAAISVATRQQAKDAIDVIDAAINDVSMQRAGLGALQNRLEHTVNNLGVTTENLQAAESSIRDVDMAKEMMEFTKNSILVQASQAMLAQANALPQGVLSLLG